MPAPPKEESEDVQEGEASRKENSNALAMFAFHFLTTCVANTIVCVGTIMLWSTLGHAADTFKLLDDHSKFAVPMMGAVFLLVLLLYLLDFFWPQHIPGQVMVLWDGDRFVGRTIFAVTVVLFAMASMLRVQSFESMPLIISIVLCPLAVFGVTVIYDPWKPVELTDSEGKSVRKTAIISSDSVPAKIALLKRITGEEQNTHMYYKAVETTFFLTFAWMLGVWIVCTVVRGKPLSELSAGLSKAAKDRLYVQWTAPLVLAVANLVFGFFALFRVLVHTTYSRTDKYKNQLVADLMGTSMLAEMSQHHADQLVRSRNSGITHLEHGQDLAEKRQQYLQQDAIMAQNLSAIIKGTSCVFVLLLGVGYASQQLLATVTHVATMVIGIVVVFFAFYTVFAYVSLRRIVQAMGKWMKEVPAWQTLMSIVKNDFVVTMCLCVFAPLVPGILLLSIVNQKVRQCRRIYDRHQLTIIEDLQPRDGEEAAAQEISPRALCLTPRIYLRLQAILRLDMKSIVLKVYLVCLIPMMLWVFPSLFNVGLAGLRKLIQEAQMSFGVILVIIFVTGLICFLLPPVPGMVVYFFAGLMVADNCPPRGTDKGFWTGAIVNLLLCWALKLTACAVQQVGIGGMLKKSLLIRQTCGVHRTPIRCIEAVLRKKGLSAGKVAILCGGPDWPTSVLAGILGLSLIECEIGTLPIIGFIAPFALSGSFYLKSGDGSMLANAAQLMAACSLMVSGLMLAIGSWAVQQVLERHGDEVKRPLAQNVDLEWLDYRSAYVEKKVQFKFGDIPPAIRSLWVLGALAQIGMCHLFVFGYSYLIGTFEVSDDFSTLKLVAGWSPKDGLYTYAALCLFAIYGLSWCSNLLLNCWKRRVLGPACRGALAEAEQMEAEWKDAFIKRADAAAQKGATDAAQKGATEDPPAEASGAVSKPEDAPAKPSVFVSV